MLRNFLKNFLFARLPAYSLFEFSIYFVLCGLSIVSVTSVYKYCAVSIEKETCRQCILQCFYTKQEVKIGGFTAKYSTGDNIIVETSSTRITEQEAKEILEATLRKLKGIIN